VFSVDTIFGGQQLKPGKVSFDKPKHLAELESKEPEYLLTQDLKELQREAVREAPQIITYQPPAQIQPI